jgi:hypothetical protein
MAAMIPVALGGDAATGALAVTGAFAAAHPKTGSTRQIAAMRRREWRVYPCRSENLDMRDVNMPAKKGEHFGGQVFLDWAFFVV